MRKIKYNLIFSLIALVIGILIVETYVSGTEITENQKTLQLAVVFAFACISFFIPDVIKAVAAGIRKSREAKELRILKKLFVICGSERPVDFVSVMKKLSGRAVYHREFLEKIIENHKRSDTDNEEFYFELMKETENMSLRLFCEKLNMAENYDFDKAVKSISEDFQREQREYARFVKKKTELIQIVGVVGLFLLITVLMVWLMGPWMEMLDMNSLL